MDFENNIDYDDDQVQETQLSNGLSEELFATQMSQENNLIKSRNDKESMQIDENDVETRLEGDNAETQMDNEETNTELKEANTELKELNVLPDSPNTATQSEQTEDIPLETSSTKRDDDDAILNEILSEENLSEPTTIASSKISKPKTSKQVIFPLARVKAIMKQYPDCNIISQDAVVIVTKAAELFLSHMGNQLAKSMANSKKKTVARRDFDAVIENEPRMCFLDGGFDGLE